MTVSVLEQRGDAVFNDVFTPSGADIVTIDSAPTEDLSTVEGRRKAGVPSYMADEVVDRILAQQAAREQDAENLNGQRIYAARLISAILGEEISACDARHVQVHTMPTEQAAAERRPVLDTIRLDLTLAGGRVAVDLFRFEEGLAPSPRQDSEEQSLVSRVTDAILAADRFPAGTVQTLADTNLELGGAAGFTYSSASQPYLELLQTRRDEAAYAAFSEPTESEERAA